MKDALCIIIYAFKTIYMFTDIFRMDNGSMYVKV